MAMCFKELGEVELFARGNTACKKPAKITPRSKDTQPPWVGKSPLYCGNTSGMRGRDKDEEGPAAGFVRKIPRKNKVSAAGEFCLFLNSGSALQSILVSSQLPNHYWYCSITWPGFLLNA